MVFLLRCEIWFVVCIVLDFRQVVIQVDLREIEILGFLICLVGIEVLGQFILV